MERHTIEQSAIAMVEAVVLGGYRFRIRLSGLGLAERYPHGEVIGTDGSVIGCADSYTYGGSAFAVHTAPFAGYVAFGDCDWV
jgi:hypothetical protein